MKKTAQYRKERPVADHNAKISQGMQLLKIMQNSASNQDGVIDGLFSHLKNQTMDKIH